MARMNALADIAKGLKANIHAIDNLSPVSRVAAYVKAGSRYEPDHLPGISHYTRAAAGLTTEDSSIFGITRHLERVGASCKVTSDREHIIYRVDCMRDKLGHVLKFMDDMLHKPEYRAWELVDHVQPKLKEEVSRMKTNILVVANEALHKTAFRGGLAHSSFIPDFQIEKINKTNLFEYYENNFVLDRMSFSGLGVDENEIRNIIEEKFRLNGEEYKGVSGATRYVGGEARIQAGFPKTQVNFVVEGSSITNLKALAALDIIGFMIGGSDQVPIKYGEGPGYTLTSLMHKFSPAIKTSVININYTDIGLFGFSLAGPQEVMREPTKAAVKHVRKLLNNVSENDLKGAKKAAKVRALIQSENQEAVFEAMSRRHAAGVTGQSPLEHIEKLTLKDVQTVAQGLLKSKPTLVSVGNPRFVPCIDELDS